MYTYLTNKQGTLPVPEFPKIISNPLKISTTKIIFSRYISLIDYVQSHMIED